jgi:hypothetical protein
MRGQVHQLGVGDEGNTLYADLAGVPKWLGAPTKNPDGSDGPSVLSVAYPNRSVEAWFDVTSLSTQKHHKMIITSVALLGENLPGVQTLDDLQMLFSEDPGEEWIDGLTAGIKAAVANPTEGGEVVPPTRVAASVDTSDVRSAFYEQVAVDDRYWWWLHQMYLDPSLCIAEDESGEYWTIPYSVSGNDIEFEEPQKAYIQWVLEETGAVAAKLAAGQKFPNQANLSFASAEESRPGERQKEYNDKHNKEAKGSVPIDIEALRKLPGMTDLPDDATEEQINEALAALPEPSTDDDNEQVVEEADAPVTASARKKVLAELKAAGMVLVDAESHTATQATVAELKADKDAAELKRRKGVVLQAVRDRKIPLSRKEHWDGMMTQDPEGTEAFLSAAPKNAVPGPPVGTDESIGDPESVSSGNVVSAGTGLFPKLDASRAARARARR